MKNFFILSCLLILILNQSCDDVSEKGLVHDLESLHSAMRQAQPGDAINMANGVWENVEIVFKTHGIKDNLIYLKAREPGKVFIEGNVFHKCIGTLTMRHWISILKDLII